METIDPNRSPDQIIAKIHALDLAPIKFKLMDAEEGYGWSREYADHIEIEYKRFLTLLVKYPEASIAPSKEVDKFWHGHILDTLKYAEDCNKVFGYFLHHFPYFGMRGSEDAANLSAAADTMNLLYREEFGDAKPAQARSFCGAASVASFCGAAVGKESQAAPQETSFCGAAVAASFCGAATGKEDQVAEKNSSFCGATEIASSFCGAANIGDANNGISRESVLNTVLRPSLPPLGR